MYKPDGVYLAVGTVDGATKQDQVMRSVNRPLCTGSVLHNPDMERCDVVLSMVQSHKINLYAADQSTDVHGYPYLDTRFGGGVGPGIGWPPIIAAH